MGASHSRPRDHGLRAPLSGNAARGELLAEAAIPSGGRARSSWSSRLRWILERQLEDAVDRYEPRRATNAAPIKTLDY
jgi:hypothetical protein